VERGSGSLSAAGCLLTRELFHFDLIPLGNECGGFGVGGGTHFWGIHWGAKR